MKITVLGGTGFIGHHVTRWLVEAGESVTVIHRGQTPSRVPGARLLTADRHEEAGLAQALDAAAPKVLIDMTAYTARDMELLLAVAPVSLQRLVVISSGDVYWTYGAFLGLDSAGGPRNELLDETAPLRDNLYPYRSRAKGMEDPLYFYEKIQVERTAFAGAKGSVTVLRLPMVYGPGDFQRRVGSYLDRMRAAGAELRLNSAEAAWRCTRGYVEDVAWAIRLAARDARASGEIFNLGEPSALTELEWVRAVGTAAGWSGQVVADVSAKASLPARWDVSLSVDTSRIRRLLEFREPVGREEGLRRTLL
ncbi:MAG: NAD-dependent epimerase/dehydratase family protein [Gemmatimonadales bacterium]